MKKLLLILLCLPMIGFGQDIKRGYVGVSFGFASPSQMTKKEYAMIDGTVARLVDFNYRINNNIGLAYSWWGHHYPVNPALNNIDWDFYGVGIHTLGVSQNISNKKKYDFDLKTSIAYTTGVNGPGSEELSVPSKKSEPGLGYSIGLASRYYVTNYLAITYSIDYLMVSCKHGELSMPDTYYQEPHFYYNFGSSSRIIENLNVSVGIGYVWKGKGVKKIIFE